MILEVAVTYFGGRYTAENTCGGVTIRGEIGGDIKIALIYRDELLSMSETFISAQADALRSFQPRFVGLGPAALNIPLTSPTVLLTEGRSAPQQLRKMLYKLTGIGPGFHRRVSSLKGNLLHAHFAIDGVHALPLASHLGIPLIVTLHGYDVSIYDEYQRKTIAGAHYLWRRSELWKRASMFLCVSDFIREQALRGGFPEKKLRVHYIGINRSQFPPQDGTPEQLVLFIGRLVEKKGVAHLLQAMKLVQDTQPEAQLVILGFGELHDELNTLAKELGVRCTFLGPQPRQEVRKWLGRARVLCVPSITAANGDTEGLPTVVVEAQAMGIPVVAYRHAGIPEILLDGVTGLLCEEGDYEGLANALLRYLSENELWARSSREGKMRVAEHFDLNDQTRKLEAIYDEVIGSQAAGVE